MADWSVAEKSGVLDGVNVLGDVNVAVGSGVANRKLRPNHNTAPITANATTPIRIPIGRRLFLFLGILVCVIV